MIAAVRNFDNQRRKDVKPKQHYCPLKQDHPKELNDLGRRTSKTSVAKKVKKKTVKKKGARAK